MNLYFAGWGSKDADRYLREKDVHRLLSQYNERRVLEEWVEGGLYSNLFIDSGAFSVAHSNAKIDVDEYIGYINNHSEINIWVELDSIPYPVLNNVTAKACSEKSWETYLYMRDRVFPECTLLPLYHFGEPKSGLLRILDTEVNGTLPSYIGVGGRHGVSTEAQAKYFNEIFTIIQNSKNPNVRVHGFGITVPRLLNYFPFYSADSTTWLQVAISGGVLTEDLQTIRISDGTTYDKTNIQSMPKDALDILLPTVEKYNYDFTELCADYKVRLRYNIDVMLNWEKQYTYEGPKIFKSQKLF